MDRGCTMEEQLYTMQQIAEFAGVSRTTVFRYVQKENIQPHVHELNRKQYNEQQKNLIVAAINPGVPEEGDQDPMSFDSGLINFFKTQLETKDDQIAILQKTLDHQQKQNLKIQNDLENTRQQLAIEIEKTKKSFFTRLFGG